MSAVEPSAIVAHLYIFSLVHDFLNLFGKRLEQDFQIFVVVELSRHSIPLIREVHGCEILVCEQHDVRCERDLTRNELTLLENLLQSFLNLYEYTRFSGEMSE